MNTYRPHQSRHQIIEILKNQLNKRIETIKELNENYNENLKILSKINFDEFQENLKRKRKKNQFEDDEEMLEEEEEKKFLKKTTTNEIDLKEFENLFKNIKKKL